MTSDSDYKSQSSTVTFDKRSTEEAGAYQRLTANTTGVSLCLVHRVMRA